MLGTEPLPISSASVINLVWFASPASSPVGSGRDGVGLLQNSVLWVSNTVVPRIQSHTKSSAERLGFYEDSLNYLAGQSFKTSSHPSS